MRRRRSLLAWQRVSPSLPIRVHSVRRGRYRTALTRTAESCPTGSPPWTRGSTHPRAACRPAIGSGPGISDRWRRDGCKPMVSILRPHSPTRSRTHSPTRSRSGPASATWPCRWRRACDGGGSIGTGAPLRCPPPPPRRPSPCRRRQSIRQLGPRGPRRCTALVAAALLVFQMLLTEVLQCERPTRRPAWTRPRHRLEAAAAAALGASSRPLTSTPGWKAALPDPPRAARQPSRRPVPDARKTGVARVLWRRRTLSMCKQPML